MHLKRKAQHTCSNEVDLSVKPEPHSDLPKGWHLYGQRCPVHRREYGALAWTCTLYVYIMASECVRVYVVYL